MIITDDQKGDTIEVVGDTEPFLREVGFNSCHFAFYTKALYMVTNSLMKWKLEDSSSLVDSKLVQFTPY